MKELTWCHGFLELGDAAATVKVPDVRTLVRDASPQSCRLMWLQYYLDDRDMVAAVSEAVTLWVNRAAETLSLSEPMHPDTPKLLLQLWRSSYAYIPVSGVAAFCRRLALAEWEIYRKLGSNDLCGAFRKFAAEYTNAMVVYNANTDGLPEYPRRLLPEYVTRRIVNHVPLLA